MELSKTIGEQMGAARQLEKDGKLSEAALIYQKLFKADPTSQQIMRRLLVMYRKLKDYNKELSVLNDAIAAYQLRQQSLRDKWIQSHPKAASAGKSMLRQLEKAGKTDIGWGPDPMIEGWMRRKVAVTAKITGKKIKRDSKPEKVKKAAGRKKAGALRLVPTEAAEKKHLRDEAIEARKKAAQERRDASAKEKREEKERKTAEDAKGRKKEATQDKSIRRDHPSLFVIILRYLVSIDEIDALMKQHMSYLDKHYDTGEFLVSGRQVPRTGGVILARGKNRNTVEKIIKKDPFVKRKLVAADIIEFTVSQVGKGLEGWLGK